MSILVIIHGGWGGGWCWQATSRSLRRAGHEVYTPTLTGMGDRIHLAQPSIDLDTHIWDVVNMVIAEDLQEVILPGHSYGGMVMTGVAELVPERLVHLVYLDAFVPTNGECLLDLLEPGSRAVLDHEFQNSDDGWRGSHDLSRPWPDPIPPRLALQPWKTFTQPLRIVNPETALLPRTYIRCTADKGPEDFMGQSFSRSFARAQAAGWPIQAVAGDHNCLFTTTMGAEVLAELIPTL